MAIERKIARSFGNVKKDISSLREQLSRIAEQQGELMDLVLSIKAQNEKVAKKVTKKK
ncbi:MAG: hypothetical protein AABX54_02090 [Nanoarchaeota archaeon]